jgi:hypothetical protein
MLRPLQLLGLGFVSVLLPPVSSGDGGVVMVAPAGYEVAGPDDCPTVVDDAVEALYFSGSQSCVSLVVRDPQPIDVRNALELMKLVYRPISVGSADEPRIPGAVYFTLLDDPEQAWETLVFTGAAYLYSFEMHSEPGAATSVSQRRALLAELALDQLEAEVKVSGPVPADPADPEVSNDPELSRLLVDVPTVLGEDLQGPISVVDSPVEFPADKQAIADVLYRRTRSAQTAWFGDGIGYFVKIDRHPVERFTAATLGLTESLPLSSDTTLTVADLPDGAIARRYPTTNGSGGTTGVFFRRGPLLISVIVSTSIDSQAMADLDGNAAIIAAAQAATIPDGGSEPYYFPSLLAGSLATLGLVTGAGVGLPLVARRLARLRAPIMAQGGPPLAGAPTLDSSQASRKLRRRGLALLLVQAAALNVAVIGFLGALGWIGWLLGLVALLCGVFATRWARDNDLVVPGRQASVPAVALSAVALSAVALGCLVAGLGFSAAALRDLTFGPSLSIMEQADAVAVSPEQLSGAKALGGLALLVVGAALARTARARWRADANRLRLSDPRPPVLYLRSFDDDNIPLPSNFSARHPFTELVSLRGSTPFEEIVAWELSRYGPVIAVGRQHQSLASLGAAREHLDDRTWRTSVTERMTNAALIVVTIGATPGLAWELDTLASSNHLSRTIFVFPPLPADELRQRWNFVTVALRQAGTEIGPLGVDPGSTLYAIPGPRSLAVIGDRRDEASYQAGLRRLLDSIATSPDAVGKLDPGQCSPVSLASRQPS